MTTLALRSRATAKRLVEKYGREIIFQKPTNVLVDPNRPDGATKKILQTSTQYGVFDDYKVIDNNEEKTVKGFKNIITYYNDVDLNNFVFVKDGDTVWKIDDINAIQPGNEIIAYEVRVKL